MKRILKSIKMPEAYYVFIDESGDLGMRGSKYFVIAAIMTSNPTTLKRIIKKLRQKKLKKKIKELPEIKANNSKRTIREYVLKEIKNSNCEIFAVVVDKSKILSRLYEVKDKLYNYLCGQLIDRITRAKNLSKLIITIDKKHTNSLIREDFNHYIQNIIETKNHNLPVGIFHKPSYASEELQVIDFIAWSINRKYSFDDEYYYKIIENKIVNKDNILLWK